MSFTNAAFVQAVLAPGKDYDSVNNPDLTRQIAGAEVMVNRLVINAANRKQTLTAGELVEIATWVAAHLYCVSDQTYQSKSTGGASASFKGQTGQGLEATLYGQSALRLDWTGVLDGLDKRAVAWGYSLGAGGL